jgi:hypothetical protein
VVVDAEDYDLWLRIADRFQFANLEAVLLKYRIHPFQVSMRKTAQQILGTLAAQAAASSRKKGLPDPLDSVAAVTGETLAALGVTTATLHNRLASRREFWIRNMCAAGEYSAALDAALETLRYDLKCADPRLITELQLIVSKLYWQQKRFGKCLIATGQALKARPAVTNRLGKALLRRLRGACQRAMDAIRSSRSTGCIQ